MPTFNEAFDRFRVDGFFELDTPLYTEQLERLRLCTRFLRVDKPEIPPYQFHLNNVKFIRGDLPRPEQLIDGAVVEHHAQRHWTPRIADVALLQMARPANELNMGLRFNDSNGLATPADELFEFVLADLLSQADTWSSIKIDGVFFGYKNMAPDYLNGCFHNFLLKELAEQAGTSLKELSLKPFSLSNSVTALVNFLAQSVSLETLHLEITEASRADWLELSQALAGHPNLKYLNFGKRQFDEDIYFALSKLLDENYRIEGINIAAPTTNWSLIDVHKQFNQRVSKPCQVRFKEERLSLEVLLELAFQTLVEREEIQLEQPAYRIDDEQESKQALLMRRVGFLLSNQGALAITDTEKAMWLKEAYVLPTVYLNHKEYMKESSALLQLRLDELVLGGANTVGYLLLEKAFAARDTPIIQCLLESKADLFEPPPEDIEKPFLVRLFEAEGPWQELVIVHLKKDLNVLVPAVKILSPYSKLEPICNELKEHLNTYFNILENRKKQPKLLRLLKGVMSNFQGRPEECAQSFHNLAWYIKVATDDGAGKKVTYDSLFEAQEILEQILEDSRQANRGIWGRSKLHDDLLSLGKKLDKQLKLHQRELYRREKNKRVNYFTGGCAQDNVEFEKTKTELAKEQEARKEERKRHEQERKRHEQERERYEEERERYAQDRRETRTEIEELKRLILAQNRSKNQVSEEAISSQAQERPGSSSNFFARR